MCLIPHAPMLLTVLPRLEIRRIYRNMKKDGLQVSLGILKQSLSTYQSLVKDEKNKFLSDVIARNPHKPKIDFNLI